MPQRFVFDTREVRRYRFPTHANELVMDRSESAACEVFVAVIEPGRAPPRHQHDDTEQVFYILAGEGVLEVGQPLERHRVTPGQVVRIPPATPHSVQCTGPEPLRYLVVDCFPGGRPASEPSWEDHVRMLCREQGWDLEDVRS